MNDQLLITKLSKDIMYRRFLRIILVYRFNESGNYFLNTGSEVIPVYCHMVSDGTGENGECGGGGWTLIMKIDGSRVIRTDSSSLKYLLIKISLGKGSLLCPFQNDNYFYSFIPC